MELGPRGRTRPQGRTSWWADSRMDREGKASRHRMGQPGVPWRRAAGVPTGSRAGAAGAAHLVGRASGGQAHAKGSRAHVMGQGCPSGWLGQVSSSLCPQTVLPTQGGTAGWGKTLESQNLRAGRDSPPESVGSAQQPIQGVGGTGCWGVPTPPCAPCA